MNLSKETLNILKNFATINPSLIFNQGTEQKTVSPQKTILAKANITENLPQDFAIFDLNQFLNIISLFDNPSLEFESDHIIIGSSEAKIKYRFAKAELIQSPPKKSIALPSNEVSFTLGNETFKYAFRAATILNVPEIAVVGRNGKAYLVATDTKSDSSNAFEYEVGEAFNNYRMIFKTENLKLLERDYTVTISVKGISHFKSSTGDVEYWIATEQNSSFE